MPACPSSNRWASSSFCTWAARKLRMRGSRTCTGLSKLRELHVMRTSVTEAGVQRLQQALPKCVIQSKVPGERG